MEQDLPFNAGIAGCHAALAAFLHNIDTSRLLGILRKDSRALLTAAARAEAACGFLLRAIGLDADGGDAGDIAVPIEAAA